MRKVFLWLALLWFPFSVRAADVTVNPEALEPPASTGGPASAAPAPATAPAKAPASRSHRRNTTHKASTAKSKAGAEQPSQSAGKPASSLATQTQPKNPAATGLVVPQAAPPPAELPPALPDNPKHPPPTIVPPRVVAGAPGQAVPIPGGVRVTFAADSADLNPETEAAIQKLAHAEASHPSAMFTIIAAATGPENDPSTPRRMALSRGLAARAVLLEQGIPSPHIFVRVLPPNAAGQPGDRVDVTVAEPETRPVEHAGTPVTPTP
ncbi:MAG: hypothetical protein K6U10_00830 [Acidobacteriia bacterium]|nr:hypothetical protein [Methyloceanibacter sp.]MCL6490347.1 hypothetical protein [Terriglobia bacterium]